MHYKYELTCEACPEQYDVKDKGGKQVAYIRLRRGCLRVDVPDAFGETVFYHEFGEDDYKGCFYTDMERNRFLKRIDKAIHKHYYGHSVQQDQE